jgi:hypothetical protein
MQERYKVPKDILDMFIEMFACNDVFEEMLKPNWRKAIRVRAKFRHLKWRAWHNVYRLYPELKGHPLRIDTQNHEDVFVFIDNETK